MPAECEACESQVEPVSAPVVAGDIDTDCQISVYELNGLDVACITHERTISTIAFFCPVCRYVFEHMTPDLSWLWADWSGIPVVVDERPSRRLGID